MKKTIMFLGCGKNQENAIKTASKLGWKIIGVDNAIEPYCSKYLDEHICQSKEDLTDELKKIKADMYVSFSPGKSSFVAQDLKNTVGEFALETIRDNAKWLCLLREYWIVVPATLYQSHKKIVMKSASNETCGGEGVEIIEPYSITASDCLYLIGTRILQEYIEGDNFYHVFAVKNGEVLKSIVLNNERSKANGNKVKLRSKLLDIKKIIKTLQFKSGILIVEEISGVIIDLGIEIEPLMVEQFISYEEIFKLYE